VPAYGYICKDCSNVSIIFLSIKEFEAKPEVKCPHYESDSVQNELTGFFTETSKKS